MCVVLGAESMRLFAKETVPRHHSREGHSGQICLSKRDICDPCQLWFAQTSYRPDVPCLPSLRPTTCLDGPTLLAARKKLGVRVGFGVVRLREDAAVRWPPRHSCRALQSFAELCSGSNCFRRFLKTQPLLHQQACMHDSTSMQDGRTSHGRSDCWDEAIHSCGPLWKQPRRGRAGRLQTPRIIGGR